MSHQEKERIFDEYAKSKEYKNFEELIYLYVTEENSAEKIMSHIFAACDLVQEKQRERISANAKIQQESCGDPMTCGCMGRCDYPVSFIDKKSITNPENKIQ